MPRCRNLTQLEKLIVTGVSVTVAVMIVALIYHLIFGKKKCEITYQKDNFGNQPEHPDLIWRNSNPFMREDAM